VKKRARPFSVHPRGETMKLIERFAVFRKRKPLDVLRVFKAQDTATRRSMLQDMQRMLEEQAAKEAAEEAAANTATMGDPGAGRFERIMRRQQIVALSNRLAAVPAEQKPSFLVADGQESEWDRSKCCPPELASDDGPEVA
jgi:hypothetical protein